MFRLIKLLIFAIIFCKAYVIVNGGSSSMELPEQLKNLEKIEKYKYDDENQFTCETKCLPNINCNAIECLSNPFNDHCKYCVKQEFEFNVNDDEILTDLPSIEYANWLKLQLINLHKARTITISNLIEKINHKFNDKLSEILTIEITNNKLSSHLIDLIKLNFNKFGPQFNFNKQLEEMKIGDVVTKKNENELLVNEKQLKIIEENLEKVTEENVKNDNLPNADETKLDANQMPGRSLFNENHNVKQGVGALGKCQLHSRVPENLFNGNMMGLHGQGVIQSMNSYQQQPSYALPPYRAIGNFEYASQNPRVLQSMDLLKQYENSFNALPPNIELSEQELYNKRVVQPLNLLDQSQNILPSNEKIEFSEQGQYNQHLFQPMNLLQQYQTIYSPNNVQNYNEKLQHPSVHYSYRPCTKDSKHQQFLINLPHEMQQQQHYMEYPIMALTASSNEAINNNNNNNNNELSTTSLQDYQQILNKNNYNSLNLNAGLEFGKLLQLNGNTRINLENNRIQNPTNQIVHGSIGASVSSPLLNTIAKKTIYKTNALKNILPIMY